MTLMQKALNDILDLCICEFRKRKNQQKIEDEILGPVIDFILEKVKPYILGMSIFLITIILLMICILYLILIPKTKIT